MEYKIFLSHTFKFHRNFQLSVYRIISLSVSLRSQQFISFPHFNTHVGLLTLFRA